MAVPAKKAINPKKTNVLETSPPTSLSVQKTLRIETHRVKAYSQRHAMMIAAAMYSIPEDMITECKVVNKPGSATVTDNADFPQRGTRSWVTEYQIFTYASRIAVGLNKFEYIGVELVKGGFSEKTPAVKEAKKLCIKHGVPMMVQIAKVLEKDDPATLICEPKTALGEYSISFVVDGIA